jgi:type IV pilus assembly protein PilC
MAVFNWEGKTRTGEAKKGQMDAPNEAAVLTRLRAQQILPSKVRKKPREITLPSFGGIPQKQLIVFTRQFATMIDAGLPLVQCLDVIAMQLDHKGFRTILLEVKADVEGGSTFADALRKHPRAFDDLYVNLVAAGEVGGILDTILNRLAAYIEKNAKLKRQVKGAMVYPIAILIVAIVVIIVMLWKVIPVFENMFKDFGGATLPAPTQFVINISNWFVNNAFFIMAALTAFIIGFVLFLRNKNGRRVWDKFILRTPIFGPLLRKVAVARFTRTLGTMISSGVPILEALDVVARTAGNMTVQAAILYTRERISEGRNMAEPLGETKVFPPMVVQMIAVGESTGALDNMLSKIADFYEEEVEVAVAALTSLLEPIMMVVLGGIVGGIIVAMYLPIFELAGAISQD